ncbi:hypothetical protein RD110_17065 [Rhodoferax koreense]|uniref:GAF domain-containing protein n=1 Tax=Rhodoferax koreensis TaxID=1842727 RepID=A0A1P8JYE8_9BURK|nr:GAF domain-containing protein [Rhodoferax koreense]APW38701.1 hypothetical protein RD110_17065 [Rhodoferax koreense]
MRFSTSTFLDIPTSHRATPTRSRIDSVREALRTGGIENGLRELNLGVPHRYSGIFRLDGDLLQNTHMVDKQGLPRPDGLETVVLSDSFCQIVLRDGFLLADHSGRDPRLAASPYQNIVVAYHGVPILDNAGELSGTLCHFDMVEQSISDAEFACLQEAARLFAGLLSRRS